jgi:hypothetical protein
MIKFEDPIQFNITVELEANKISYSNLMEICQGCPEIGNVYINNKRIDKYKFGGPCLLEMNYVYIPMFIKNIFSSGFKLAIINIDTLEIRTIGGKMPLIFLDKIKDGRIYYYKDLNKTIIDSLEL